MKASGKMKVGLTLTFMTRSIGLATSILRFVTFSENSAVLDGTWSSTQLQSFTIFEVNTYLIAACLPTYRPLFQAILCRSPWLRDFTSTSSPPEASHKPKSEVAKNKKLSSAWFLRYWGKNDLNNLGSLGSFGGTVNSDSLGDGDQIRLKAVCLDCGMDVIPE